MEFYFKKFSDIEYVSAGSLMLVCVSTFFNYRFKSSTSFYRIRVRILRVYSIVAKLQLFKQLLRIIFLLKRICLEIFGSNG